MWRWNDGAGRAAAVAAVLLAFAGAGASRGEEWRDVAGNAFEAELAGADDGWAEFKLPDGKKIRFAYRQLSRESEAEVRRRTGLAKIPPRLAGAYRQAEASLRAARRQLAKGGEGAEARYAERVAGIERALRKFCEEAGVEADGVVGRLRRGEESAGPR